MAEVSDKVTITVSRDDMEEALSDIMSTHGEYCTSYSNCGCEALYDRLEKALAEGTNA
jgi:hypothetical protein